MAIYLTAGLEGHSCLQLLCPPGIGALVGSPELPNMNLQPLILPETL